LAAQHASNARVNQTNYSGGLPFSADTDGVTLAIRVTPRASRTEIVGVRDMTDGRLALAVRIASPPAEGKANAALIVFLAERLGVGRGAISLRAGTSARLKLVRISGDGPALAARLAALVRP